VWAVQTAPHQSSLDPLVGRTLEGRYRILGRVARGGMSVVYEAVDQRLDRLVAVKVMAAALSADPAFSDRFSREARAAARLSHVNAVAVFDQGVDEATGHVFLVMELVDGRTLREYIRERQGRFSAADAVSIMEPVLAALAAAHRAGIVHRDVKPENILLSDDGVVKVADFGLARAIESNAESTRTGLMMGTVAYCSPEQITRGQGDQRSDVYSAGIVLFELLTGAPPFTGESAMNVAYQHVHNRVPAPSSINQDVPGELDELVVAATDSDPAGRPGDAADFLAELADIRARLVLPVVAIPPRERRPGSAQAAPKVSDSTPTGVIGAAAVRPMPATGLGGTRDTRDLHPSLPATSGSSRAGRAPRSPRRPPTKIQRARRRGLVALVIIVLLGLAGGLSGWWFASGRYSRVPDVAGRSQSDAVQAIVDAGYKTGTIDTKHSHTATSGTVISTDPKLGSRLARGKSVDLVISSGKDMITVPAISKGTLKDQVGAQLQARGLKVNWAEVFNDSVPANGLVKLRPAAGTSVERGYTTVTVTLSKGPDWVTLPVIADGAKWSDVQSALKAAALNPVRKDAYSDTVPKDSVISLNPSDRQIRGHDITVTVSKGPELVTIPRFEPFSTRADDAEQQLRNLGLDVQVSKLAGGHFGFFYSVDPASGTKVKVGSPVTLTVI